MAMGWKVSLKGAGVIKFGTLYKKTNVHRADNKGGDDSQGFRWYNTVERRVEAVMVHRSWRHGGIS